MKLYEVLGKYLPDEPDGNYLDYINHIFENIKESGNYSVYFDAIQLMTGATYNSLTSLEPEAVLELFIKALIDWHIVELAAFFRNIGYFNDQPTR